MKTPVLFVGHGSPMNAIEDNDFTRNLKKLGQQLRKSEAPIKAILAISAHWETQGTHILNVQQPETIHDFYGFPEPLYKVQYPAPGTPELAQETLKLTHTAQLSDKWGLDHGTWSVLVHMYPQANIPVYQLSLNRNMTLQQHFDFAKELRALREQNVLILGSGNIVHNLRRIDWHNELGAFDWAEEFDLRIKQALMARDFEKLVQIEKMGEITRLSVPTLDHYLPLLYTTAVSDEKDQLSFPEESFAYGSLSMRSALWSAS